MKLVEGYIQKIAIHLKSQPIPCNKTSAVRELQTPAAMTHFLIFACTSRKTLLQVEWLSTCIDRYMQYVRDLCRLSYNPQFTTRQLKRKLVLKFKEILEFWQQLAVNKSELVQLMLARPQSCLYYLLITPRAITPAQTDRQL